MAYTAYRTWTTGEIVTAALMNEQVKDNGLLTAPAIMTGQGDLIYGSAANTPSRLAKDANSTRSLTNTGTNNNPAWAQVALATGVSGTLPVGNGGTGITSLGSNVATFLGTPSSANLRSALTDETGSGAAVFATSPTLVTPALGTPASGVLTNATGLPIAGLANGTDGELITWNASGVAAAVAVGSADEVLTSNGSGAAPTFQAAGGGAFTFVGGNTTEVTETGFTAADSIAVTSISIAADAPIDVTFVGRRTTSGSAARPIAGFKINSTTVQEAATANGVNSYYDFQNSSLAADGGGMILLLPRITNYQQGIIAHQFNSGAATGENSSGGQSIKPVIDALMPIATITSLTMRILNIDTSDPDPDPSMDSMFVFSRAVA